MSTSIDYRFCNDPQRDKCVAQYDSYPFESAWWSLMAWRLFSAEHLQTQCWLELVCIYPNCPRIMPIKSIKQQSNWIKLFILSKSYKLMHLLIPRAISTALWACVPSVARTRATPVGSWPLGPMASSPSSIPTRNNPSGRSCQRYAGIRFVKIWFQIVQCC